MIKVYLVFGILLILGCASNRSVTTGDRDVARAHPDEDPIVKNFLTRFSNGVAPLESDVLEKAFNCTGFSAVRGERKDETFSIKISNKQGPYHLKSSKKVFDKGIGSFLEKELMFSMPKETTYLSVRKNGENLVLEHITGNVSHYVQKHVPPDATYVTRPVVFDALKPISEGTTSSVARGYYICVISR